MTRPVKSPFEPRRRKELLEELVARARAWLPEWQPRDESADFGHALLEIAARLESEITERLDRAPEKMFRGFLDWLGVRGQPGRAARLPVVFEMRTGSEPVLTTPPVKLQALDADPPVVFETEDPLRIVPGRIASMVAASPADDAFFTPPREVLALSGNDAVVTEWRLKTSAPPGARQLQLDPELGLDPGVELREQASGRQYRITAAEHGIVMIEPELGKVEPKPGGGPPPQAEGLAAGAILERITDFTPFSATERNQQAHELYIGADSALNIETEAFIEVENGATIGTTGVQWEYWGKAPGGETASWLPLRREPVPGALLLSKRAGSVEKTLVENRNSRWLRARAAPGGVTGPASLSRLRLRINCRLPDRMQAPSASRRLEGIANTAPLVLGAPFYPLGREPRLFDAFYLGSKEAFSKQSARATVTFTMGTSLGGPPAAVALGANEMLGIGIGGDGKLHLIHQNDAAVRALVSTQPPGTAQHGVALSPGARPGAAAMGGFTYITVATGEDVLLATLPHASVDEASAAWTSLGELPNPAPDAPSAPNDVVRTALTRSEPVIHCYATHKGELLHRQIGFGGTWKSIQDEIEPGTKLAIATVAPVMRHDVRAGSNEDHDGIAVLTLEGRLYVREADGTWRKIGLPLLLDRNVYPLVILHEDGTRVCFAQTSKDPGPPRIVAFDLDDASKPFLRPYRLTGHAFDFVMRGGHPVALFAVTAEDGQTLAARWDPFGDDTLVLDDPLPGETLAEAPLVSGDRTATSIQVLFPGRSGAYFARTFTPDDYKAVSDALVSDALLFSPPDNWKSREHLWADLTPENAVLKEMVQVLDKPLGLSGARQALVLDRPVARAAQPFAIDVYRALRDHPRAAKRVKGHPDQVELPADDADTKADGWLLIASETETRMYEVDHVDRPPPPAKHVAVLKRSLAQAVPDPFKYRSLVIEVEDLEVTSRPAVALVGVDAGILKKLLPESLLHFQELAPVRQPILSLHAAQKRAILAHPWETGPTKPYQYDFVADAAFSAWQAFIPARPQNPAVSWEYWNGTGWWQIPDVNDGTRSFQRDGDVTFCVPSDLQPTDVVGRTNHWIRARLIGGDYGQEKVTIVTVGDGKGKTEQTVERHPESVQAPIVAAVEATYKLCCAVWPDHVLVRDSGALRDLTEANRSADAVVDYFVPLAKTLGDLAIPDTATVAVSRTAAREPPKCIDCTTGEPWSQAGPASAVRDVGVGDRALYLGIDGPLGGGPMSILFLVDEHAARGDPFPLRMDILTEQGFRPAIVGDSTRGLTESGVIVFNLDTAPPPWSLFGQALRWIRLRPRAGFDEAEWQPGIRGIYLNGAFTRAAETQELELLGSSDGSPYQRVTLARPPVLAGSMRLRVREPLGDEEIDTLRKAGVDVADRFDGREGPWVLWSEVTDTDDAPAGARVYALDDAKGDIRFGDGLHGRIPPAGRDSILAERYRRGGGEPANTIKAWGQLNLMTPIAGVERVAAPQGAAGGSDPQGASAVVRFASANLATRDRAITLRDLEVLGLQYSRDVAQVRAFPAPNGARVVAIMRGAEPRPSSAVVRELGRYLKERSAPSLAVRGALTIAGPTLRSMCVDLRLTVDAIENGGTVAREAADRIAALIDPATGGLDGTGWALGVLPSQGDVAAALADIEHLDGVDAVEFADATADGETRSPPRPLRPAELVTLVRDGVRVTIAITEQEPA